MSYSFFISDAFRFGSILLGIIISSWVIISRIEERSRGEILEVLSMVTFGIGGFASITLFILHFFFSDMLASSIGCPRVVRFRRRLQVQIWQWDCPAFWDSGGATFGFPR